MITGFPLRSPKAISLTPSLPLSLPLSLSHYYFHTARVLACNFSFSCQEIFLASYPSGPGIWKPLARFVVVPWSRLQRNLFCNLCFVIVVFLSFSSQVSCFELLVGYYVFFCGFFSFRFCFVAGNTFHASIVVFDKNSNNNNIFQTTSAKPSTYLMTLMNIIHSSRGDDDHQTEKRVKVLQKLPG